MLPETVNNELTLLRHGTLDTTAPLSFDQLSCAALIDELRATHPFVFQERHIGRKHEIALSRKVAYKLEFQGLPKSLFQGVRLTPMLSQCYLISSYDDVISEITPS